MCDNFFLLSVAFFPSLVFAATKARSEKQKLFLKNIPYALTFIEKTFLIKCLQFFNKIYIYSNFKCLIYKSGCLPDENKRY